tara:strand:+ start:1428 stop:1943 length:516 start_codon:yes stop_codon:yes gene_type:complete
MRIFIIGPTASGKTTIGKKLAEGLNMNFIDTDKEIEKATGVDITWLFDIEGEEGFREREEDILLKVSKLNSCVISTGAGSILKESNRDLISSSGKVIYLEASIESQLKRTSFDNARPLLSKGNKEKILKKMDRDRRHLYEELADITIKPDKKSRNEIVNEITLELKKNSDE